MCVFTLFASNTSCSDNSSNSVIKEFKFWGIKKWKESSEAKKFLQQYYRNTASKATFENWIFVGF